MRIVSTGQIPLSLSIRRWHRRGGKVAMERGAFGLFPAAGARHMPLLSADASGAPAQTEPGGGVSAQLRERVARAEQRLDLPTAVQPAVPADAESSRTQTCWSTCA